MTAETCILNYLAFKDVPQNAKDISVGTSINHNTVRTTLTRMANDNKIIRYDRGLYLHKNMAVTPKGAVYEKVKLHGIKLEFYNETKCIKFHTGCFLDSHVNYTIHRHKTNHSITLIDYWDDHKVTFTFHSKLIEVYINVGKSGIDCNEFKAFSSYLQGCFPKISKHDWNIRQFAFNVDYYGYRLEGIKKLTLQLFENYWWAIYQKEQDKVRIEAHGITIISFGQAMQMFSDFTTFVQNKYAAGDQFGK